MRVRMQMSRWGGRQGVVRDEVSLETVVQLLIAGAGTTVLLLASYWYTILR